MYIPLVFVFLCVEVSMWTLITMTETLILMID